MAVASKTFKLLGVFLFLFIATAVSVSAIDLSSGNLLAAYTCDQNLANNGTAYPNRYGIPSSIDYNTAVKQFGNASCYSNAVGDRISINDSSFNFGANFSIAMYIRPNTSNVYIAGKDTAGNIGYLIYLPSAGSRTIRYGQGGGPSTIDSPSNFITHNQWNCLVISRQNRTVTMYNGTTFDTQTVGADPGTTTGAAMFMARTTDVANGLMGYYDEMAIWNTTLTTTQMQNYCLYGFQDPFMINLRDGYNNSVVNNFNATITFANGTNENWTTNTGTIATNISPSFSGVFNVTINSNGYHTSTYLNINSSSALNAVATQIFLTITAQNAITGVTVTNFSITTLYKNYSTTNGSVIANLTNGTIHNITISGAFSSQTTQVNYSVTPSNQSLLFYVYPTLNIRLFNETDGSAFNPNITTSTILRSFCENTTQQQSLTASTNNFNATCAWDIMRVYVTFGNDTYYRTLKPALNSTTIDFYLINLNTDTAVQKTFTLNDLSGTYGNGDLIFDKIIGTNQVTINQDAWDIENKVISYFILFDNYIVEITDNDDTTRVLGPFIADTTSSHVLTVPNIPFYGDNEIDDFQWGYLFDNQGQWLYMNYQNEEGTLTSVTYAIVNASNTSQVFYNNTFNTSSGSVNFTSISNGTMYKSLLTFNHSSWSVHTDIKTWGAIGLVLDTLEGFTAEEQYWIKSLLAVAIIIIVIFVFSGLTISAGILAGTAFTTFFYWIYWLPISTPLMTIIGLIAIMGILLAEGVR